MYDAETGWYYLQSRYYSPETCRFISADVLLSTGQGVLGHNSFAYCLNNPVNAFDEDGNLSLPNWAKVIIGVAATAAAVALTVATGGALAPVIATVVVSTGIGAVKGAVTHRVETGGWSGWDKAAIDGACDGFMGGGIAALGGAAGRAIKIVKNGVVIGESMKRVVPAAKSLNACTYRMPGYKLINFFNERIAAKLGMAHNKAWIERMVRWGVKIYDIGLDPTRIDRSAAYAMEKAITAGYRFLINVIGK